jgi:lysozyme
VSGIDVSKWQGTIDWPRVKDDGVSFAFVKATEGVGYVDPKFSTNITNAHAAGVAVGAYHFATPYTSGVNDAVAEADDFVDATEAFLVPGYLRPVLDLEQNLTLGKTTLSNWVHAWMNRVEERSGVEPLIYCSSYTTRTYLDPSVSQYDLWVAQWTYDVNSTPSTGIWNDWAFWQWSDSSAVAGISGAVDADVCRGSLTDYLIAADQPVPEPSTIVLLTLAALPWLVQCLRRRAGQSQGTLGDSGL